jgi:diguanylate cyclase (GGDEF)-like protein
LTIPDILKTLLDIIAQLTGGRGGIDHVIVNYVLAAIFFTVLLVAARAKYKEDRLPREHLLVIGFALGLSREMFMIVMAVIQAIGWADPVTLHTIFPPLEHALSTAALVTIAAAYLRYLLDDSVLARRYLLVAIGFTLLSYLSTFWWWAEFIMANPDSKFGQVWPDWVFHINGSVWYLLAAIILATKTKGWLRNTVGTAFFLFFLADVLKLPDMALDEVYENIFTPIARLCYLSAIPMLGYVYVREMLIERQQHLHNLEAQVLERTQGLETALTDLERVNRQLSENSLTDELTGLGNRRSFVTTLQEEWSRTQREQTQLSLLLIDIDYFKRINDTHGHLKGDACLRFISDNFKKGLHRPADVCFRFGGDEFAVILPSTDLAGAAMIANSIRQTIEQSDFKGARSSERLTISVGAATTSTELLNNSSTEALIAVADRALYQAKENGRNQVGVCVNDVIELLPRPHLSLQMRLQALTLTSRTN